MDVSGHILRTWMPAIHSGMTEAAKTPTNMPPSIFIFFGRAQAMKHSAVKGI
jgi:hypothetical protein